MADKMPKETTETLRKFFEHPERHPLMLQFFLQYDWDLEGESVGHVWTLLALAEKGQWTPETKKLVKKMLADIEEHELKLESAEKKTTKARPSSGKGDAG